MSGHRRRAAQRPHLGQHFLASPHLAAAFVTAAGVDRRDLVVEIGAGTGALTVPLAERAGQVWAIESDVGLARRLDRRVRECPHVMVVPGDALDLPLPARAFRVVANLPFAVTSALLRRVLEPAQLMQRADVIVQWQVARARVRGQEGRPTDQLAATWHPWWEFRRGRRLPSAAFRPRPSVDAAVLIIERRQRALVDDEHFADYSAFIADAFAGDRRASMTAPDGWVRRFGRTAGAR